MPGNVAGGVDEVILEGAAVVDVEVLELVVVAVVTLFAKGLPICFAAGNGGRPRRNLSNAMRCNSVLFETLLPNMVSEALGSMFRVEPRGRKKATDTTTQVGTQGNRW